MTDTTAECPNTRYPEHGRRSPCAICGYISPSAMVDNPPAAPWRLDVPSVPEHITCLREERTGRLWVWVQGLRAWFQWGGLIVGVARLPGELSDLGPLVEHPDPRKAAST